VVRAHPSAPYYNKKEIKKMIRTVDYYKLRRNLLREKDPVTNKRIIAKLERKIRQLEKSEDHLV
jgi:hypothetical protein